MNEGVGAGAFSASRMRALLGESDCGISPASAFPGPVYCAEV